MSKKLLLTAYLLLLALLVADRTVFLGNFFFKYTDGDQALYWYAANEASHGRFHEPCFFGQSYNSNLEPYLAVPLLWIGITPEYALPLVTQLLSLFPFLLFSFIFYRKKEYGAAFFLLCVPIIFPVEYILISSLPRGFVTGIAAVSAGAGAFLILKGKKRYFLFGFFALLGLTLNPNSIILLIPFAACSLFEESGRRDLYLFSLLGGLCASSWYLYSKWFYLRHPAHDYFKKPPLEFSIGLFKDAFKHLDDFLYGNSVLLMSLFVIFTLALYLQRQTARFVGSCCAFLVFLLSLGVNRVHEEFDFHTIFLSCGRMFLAIPVVLGIQFAWIISGNNRYLRSVTGFCMITSLSFFLWHMFDTGKLDKEASVPDRLSWVRKVSQIRDEVAPKLEELSEKYGTELFVIDLNNDAIAYGAPVVAKNRIRTFYPAGDRRTWLYREELSKMRKYLFLFDPTPQTLVKTRTAFKEVECVCEDPLIYLIRIDTTSIGAIQKMGMAMRVYE